MGLNIEYKTGVNMSKEKAVLEVAEVENQEVEQLAEVQADWVESEDEQEGFTESEVDQDDEQSEDEQESDDEPESEDEDEFYLGDDKLESPTSEQESDAEDNQEDDHKAPEWVKKLRAEYKELKRENKELKEKTTSAHEQVEKPSNDELPPKPKLEDYDYDGEAFTEAVEQWTVKKSAAEAETNKRKQAHDELVKKHEQKIETYNKRKAALKIKDFDVAEKVVASEISVPTQSAIIHYAESPEMVVLALGRSKDLRERASKINDPVELGRFIGSIEAKAKIAPKSKNSPAPTPKVAANTGTGNQSADDRALRKVFADAVIR